MPLLPRLPTRTIYVRLILLSASQAANIHYTNYFEGVSGAIANQVDSRKHSATMTM